MSVSLSLYTVHRVNKVSDYERPDYGIFFLEIANVKLGLKIPIGFSAFE